ncbi:MarR family winged helix-turn-helix transcriptional regulator [Paeniglutamicibacter cryotolerans]|uniref:DNA-binding MarR family transcriptional regulator n=1 Tax=Paeniglutamicibacter cryotolerans TaxID=670079 RepID=A0A839QK32_9MICC|nr:MarR family winged helix-turn-helix transcriptional regulator [Paeniglutamicibacter cryotolerans]MBB2994905.1 DNA-binding MarR family transcriptional regulator [Paeniglutamicibacter cryotolerans]
MSDTNEAVQWLNSEERETWLHFRQLLWQFPAALDRQLMRDSSLSTGEYSVLAALSQDTCGALRAGELARELGWERSRISHLVRRMEAKGLLRRRAIEGDGRGADLVLTEQGREMIDAAAPDHVRFVRSTLFDVLSREEALALGDMLQRVGDAARASGLPECK